MKKVKVRKQSGLPATKLVNNKADWLATVERFLATYPSVRSNHDFPEIMMKKLYEALIVWATSKIGVSRNDFLKGALEVFWVWSTLNVTLLKMTIEEATAAAPLHLRLLVSKRRKDIIARIPEMFSILMQYESLHRQVLSARGLAQSHGHFRLLLKNTLPQPLPVGFEMRLPDYFLKSPTPSQIALDYVSCARGMSSANVKKVVSFAGNSRRVLSTLHKEMKASYVREPQ
jgi:hypothetical protein